jgi:hypothetical protein
MPPSTRWVARIDLRAETATIVNAGHSPPCDSATAASRGCRCKPTRPSGLFSEARYRVQPLPLEPGDRLIFLTDSMLERNAASAEIPQLVIAGPRCIRAKRSSTSFMPFSRRRTASSTTTPPSCTSTGTAAAPGTDDRLRREQLRHVPRKCLCDGGQYHQNREPRRSSGGVPLAAAVELDPA